MTSGEYAYDLLRRLQRNFRCTNSGDRMYLYNFFGEIFNDPSVEITEEVYNAFCNQMDSDAALYAEKGLTKLQDIYSDDSFGESFQILQNSFASLGIGLEKWSDGWSGKLIFTLPSGVVKELNDYQGLSTSYLCTRTGAEYVYARQMMPYYDFEGEPILDLSTINTNVSGYGTYWEYDEAGTLEISGQGSLVDSELFYNLGIRSVIQNAVIGAGVDRLMKNSLYFPNTNMNFVFLHGSADAIQIDQYVSGTSTSETVSYYYNVYTDCDAIKQAAFQPNISVTFHPLSEWDG